MRVSAELTLQKSPSRVRALKLSQKVKPREFLCTERFLSAGSINLPRLRRIYLGKAFVAGFSLKYLCDDRVYLSGDPTNPSQLAGPDALMAPAAFIGWTIPVTSYANGNNMLGKTQLDLT